jgi:hypothetical protein
MDDIVCASIYDCSTEEECVIVNLEIMNATLSIRGYIPQFVAILPTNGRLQNIL